MFPYNAVLDRLPLIADNLMWHVYCFVFLVFNDLGLRYWSLGWQTYLKNGLNIWVQIKICCSELFLPLDPCWIPDVPSTASTMTAIKHALQRDIFTPNDERLLCIVNVCKAGKKKKNCFLCATGRQARSGLRRVLAAIKQGCVCEIVLPFCLSHHGETCPGESGEGKEVWQGGFLQTAADVGAPRSDRSGCQRCQQGENNDMSALCHIWPQRPRAAPGRGCSLTSFAKSFFLFVAPC